MTCYTFRYLNSVGTALQTAVAYCETDEDALATASQRMQAHYTTLEVWRGELVYRSTGAGKPLLSALKQEHYRNKAEELRIIAEDYKAHDARHSLLRLADDYDRMAERHTQDL